MRSVDTLSSNSKPVKEKPANSVRSETVATSQAVAAAAAADNSASVHEVLVDRPNVVHVENYDVAKLHYIQVGIAGDSDGPFIQVDALEDGGAEIAVAKASLVAQLDNVNSVGSVRIRGVIGDSVPCTLVRIYVSLFDTNTQCTAV